MGAPDGNDEELAELLLEVEVVMRAPQQESANALRAAVVTRAERRCFFEHRERVTEFASKEIGCGGTILPPPRIDLTNLPVSFL